MISLNIPDVEGFSHTWNIQNDLPWDSVAPVRRGDVHGPSLDQRLMDAIISRSLPASVLDERSSARAATIAYLYLYMILADDSVKYVILSMVLKDLHFTISHNLSPSI